MERRQITPFSVVNYFTTFVFGIIEILLFFRFILKLFGASLASEFVVWLYSTTFTLVRAFLGIFPEPDLEGPFIFEFGALFAMIVYMLVYWAIIELVKLFQRLALMAESK